MYTNVDCSKLRTIAKLKEHLAQVEKLCPGLKPMQPPEENQDFTITKRAAHLVRPRTSRITMEEKKLKRTSVPLCYFRQKT